MERWIIYLKDDDGRTLCAKPFVGTTEEADYECEFLMEVTGCDVSFIRYTEQRWNRLKKYYQPQQNMIKYIEKEWKKCQ
jgi:hypothetical protein